MIKIILAAALALGLAGCQTIAKDKQGHIIGSIGITIVLGATDLTVEQQMAICLAIGLGKEIKDHINYGGFSGQDMAANAFGCAAGVLINQIIEGDKK